MGTGTYTSDVNVSISSPVAGVELHYTLNGADPTQSDPSVANGGTVTIDRTKTLKARAWKTGWTTSPVSTATYTMQVADVTIAPASGLYPAPLTVAMSTSTPSATIYYTTDGSTPTAGSAVYSGSLIVTTSTTVKALAMRTGWTSSGVSSAAYELSAGTLSVPVITPASGSFTSSVTVSISAATGTIRYTLDNSTPSEASPVYTAPFAVTASTTVKARAFQAQWLPSDTAFAPLEIVVADPTITPGSGTYDPDQTITAVSATPGADVHYTLDGTEPTTGSPVIAASVHLTVGTYTLKVRAFKAGCTPSAIISATFATTGAFTTPAIAASWSTSLALRSDGQVWAWGDNGYYTLGDGTWNSRNTPGLVPGLTGVRQLLAGVAHIMALMPDGSLVVWGDNFDGRLGLGNNSPQLRPVTVPGLTNVAGADGGSQHTVVLLNDGTVVSSGLNNYGQLGDGTNTGRNTFAPVPGLTNVTAIHAGPYSSLALRGDGTVWAWGFNQYGQLGEGTNGNRNTPTQVTGLSNVRTLDGGYLSSAAITSDGTLWTWGDNSYGQLGDAVPSRNVPGAVPGLTYVSQVAVGDYHVVALRGDGTVWTFGRNQEGELGDGTTTGRTTPMQVAGLTDIVQIAAGQFHSMALAADGTIYVWGRNYAGTIGDGTWWNNALVPVQMAGLGLGGRAATPRITPATGTYSAAQTVTITSSSAGVVIHYTTDGSDPTETSATYTAPFSVTLDATVVARAFKTGWITSDAATSTLTFNYGTLSRPVASPPAGTYTQTQTVTLAADAGATIRYTLDGSTPSSSSPSYTAPLVVTASTTISARAFRAGWTPSTTLVASYVIQPYDGPTISAQVSPAANAAGWNNAAPLTVSFTCTAGSSPITSCTAPITFTSPGAGQVATGTAIAQDTQSATLNVTVNIDTATPTVSIVSPADASTVSENQVVITGTASDLLSGLSGVTCNDSPAILTTGTFGCAVGLTPGANSIVVRATDLAGNQATASLTLTRDATPSVRIDGPTEVTAATPTTLSAEASDPAGAALTFQWTQTAGPSVTLSGATTPNVSFVTPSADATISFAVSVSNGTQSATASVNVTVQGFASGLNLSASTDDGHESTLTIASTSLRPGFILGASDSTLVVTLASDDSATLQPAAPDEPLGIVLEKGDGQLDVTPWFTYNATDNTLSLATTHVADFKAHLTDELMTLRVWGLDSADRGVSLVLPLIYARFSLAGSVNLPTDAPPDALTGGMAFVEGMGWHYRVAVPIAADGTFSVDALPDDEYTIAVTTDANLAGIGFAALTAQAPSAQSVAVTVTAPPQRGGNGFAARRNADAQLSTEIERFANAYADTALGARLAEGVWTVPAGTKSVLLHAEVDALAGNENYFFINDHPCNIGDYYPEGNGGFDNNSMTYMFLLNGKLVASGSAKYCTVPMTTPSQVSVLDRMLDVSALTNGQAAELRVIAAATNGGNPLAETSGAIYAYAQTPDFVLTSVTELDGPGPLKRLGEGPATCTHPDAPVPPAPPVPPVCTMTYKTIWYKMIGVPVAARATGQTANDKNGTTNGNTLRWRVNYQPADATIQHVHVYMEPTHAELTFTQTPAKNGTFELKDVGFAPVPSRPVASQLLGDAYIVVDVTAQLPDGSVKTESQRLGFGAPHASHGGYILTSLFDISQIPNTATRRFSGREEEWGGDAWGSNFAYLFISLHPELHFNDISVEHGGEFLPQPPAINHQHGSHRIGTSIDVRYFGGINNDNGPNHDEPYDAESGLNTNHGNARHTAWQNAKTSVSARMTMIKWIRDNREKMDLLFDGKGIAEIYIDPIRWHSNPLLFGLFDNGTPIKDDQGNDIGAWAPHGTVKKIKGHLDHTHIEMLKSSVGNEPHP